MISKIKAISKIIIVIFIFSGMIYFLNYSSLNGNLSPSSIQQFVEGFGVLAPLIFMLVYIILLIFFFPSTILTALSGYLFGTLLGTVYVIFAATLAASISFYLAKFFGKKFVEKIEGEKFKAYNEKLKKAGFKTMIILRFLFLPYIALSYVAGLSKIKHRDFLLATFLTNIPGSFVFAYLGNSVTSPKNLILAIVLIVIVMSIPRFIKKFKKQIPEGEIGGEE